jgi:hypothetical protein
MKLWPLRESVNVSKYQTNTSYGSNTRGERASIGCSKTGKFLQDAIKRTNKKFKTPSHIETSEYESQSRHMSKPISITFM